MLICSTKGNTSGETDAGGMTTQFLIYFNSLTFICFCIGQIVLKEPALGIATVRAFQVISDDTSLHTPSRTFVLLLIYCFPRSRQSNCFPYCPFCHNSPQFTVSAINMRILSTANYNPFTYSFWNWGNIHRIRLGKTQPTLSGTVLTFHWSSLAISTFSHGRALEAFWVSWNQC